MQVDQLRQGVTRRMHAPFPFGKRGLDLLPTGLCRGKRMISIPHGNQHRRRALPAYAAAALLARKQKQHRRIDLRAQVPGHTPARDMAAVRHQIKIIKRLHCVFLLLQRLNDRMQRIVDQHHNMRAFQRGLLAHTHPRRQAAFNGPLGRPYQGTAVRAVIILLQIDLSNQAAPHPPRRNGPFHINIAVI